MTWRLSNRNVLFACQVTHWSTDTSHHILSFIGILCKHALGKLALFSVYRTGDTMQVIICAAKSVIKVLKPPNWPTCALCALSWPVNFSFFYVLGTRISSSRQQTLGGGSWQSHYIPGPEHTVSDGTSLSVPGIVHVTLCRTAWAAMFVEGHYWYSAGLFYLWVLSPWKNVTEEL